MTEMKWIDRLLEPKYWLLGIASGLILIHLTLTARTDSTDLFGTMLLFWGVVAFLIWERHETLTLESGIFSSCFGASLIALILLKSSSIYGYDFFIRITPFLSGISLALLASGTKGLKQYWQELLILAYTGIPPGLIGVFINVALLTAKFSAFILHYLGFEVVRQGVFLILEKGSVEVYHGCSGVNAILQLLGLSLVFLLMFPTTNGQKIVVPIIAVLIGFVVNAARVALMAVLVSLSQPEAFKYWHEGNGSVIFSMIAVFLFGLFCWLAILQDTPHQKTTNH
ncbi:MAG: cyanoexosortase A [Oscillatoriales cyanobacterium]|uniref:Cyanoexosortase A n=1 Tax=Microcoleus anatoxicus PTRS2 TaxID=2705321 RepID=A0ABU8YRR5_9CYAN|nr:MAG: cyanoexosortase A [Oscillatoriales cyanobacterium]TAE02255.1 MAG: cyanoexosortase A [Oscillatoriales cyanobacterium]TAE06651.1 MAG: cyanoexosortase A [Oscillatoriales cyanobacterium]TAF01912.1 MAG: cyanoexosortase A [Oscillatoriales cyanobacterium]TAF33210.1 MAG: cyanoexosortase A [Oscillatoriales cyanobacterium]